jgi:hypothetical protein
MASVTADCVGASDVHRVTHCISKHATLGRLHTAVPRIQCIKCRIHGAEPCRINTSVSAKLQTDHVHSQHKHCTQQQTPQAHPAFLSQSVAPAKEHSLLSLQVDEPAPVHAHAHCGSATFALHTLVLSSGVSEQYVPLPENPWLHVQIYVPIAFLHCPLLEHL